MTDVDSSDLNKNVLENTPVSNKILDVNAVSGRHNSTSTNTGTISTTSKFGEEESCDNFSAKDKTHIGKQHGQDSKTFEDASNCKPDISESDSQNKEQQEEDVPENFFDDFMSDDFIEGLNVVDTWEGDDINKTDTEAVTKENRIDVSTLQPGKSSIDAEHKGSSSKDKCRKEKKSKKSKRDRENRLKMVHSNSKNKEYNKSKRSRNSRSRSPKTTDSKARRDPSKTQRDILRDKDKCEKDKNTKILYEKLKVVETGLVPPGMEMEMEMQNTNKITKLEEGEILDKEPSTEKRNESKSFENKRNKSLRTDSVRYGLSKPSVGKRNHSPEPRREYKKLRSRSRSIKRIRSRSRSMKRLRSRSRSIKRRYSSRDRSLSAKRRMERRRKSLRRTRSRSLEFLDKYRHLSPLRKTSPLLKRNKELFREIGMLKARLHSKDRIMELLSPVSRGFEQNLTNKNASNMDASQSFLGDTSSYAPVPAPNQNFVPLQPVPPPQSTHVELDQQFFIGQPAMEPNNHYSMSMSQPQMLHNTGMQPNVQHNFQQNWIMEQSQQSSFFNVNNQFNMEPNSYQAPMCQPALMAPPMEFLENSANMAQPMEFLENPVNMVPQEQFMQYLPQQRTEQITPSMPISDISQGVSEGELFAKLFADNKITLSDYLSVTAKSTDNSNPIDLQNKIKVISHCQEALNELTGQNKNSGKFFLRKSQKSINKPVGEGISPFKKVPVIKFQFTTYVKQAEEKPQLATYLNRLMYKLRKDVKFQEVVQAPPPTPTPKAESKKESQKVERTSNACVQTEAVSVSDFGCQVSFDDIPSPSKNTLKKQSLAKLTPAQLLAQAEKEASPPPAPRWSSFQEPNRRNDIYRDFDDMDRRNFQSNSGRSIPGRNNVNVPNFSNRSPDQLQHLFYGKRH